MTSTSTVPPKFYQVCRLCLTVVSDNSDLVKLAVFGHDKCHSQQHQQPLIASVEAEEIVVPVAPSAITTSVADNHHHHQHQATSVIVRSANNGTSNRKNSNGGGGSDDDTNTSGVSGSNDMCDEHETTHIDNKVHNNNNNDLDHATAHEKNVNYFGTAASTNYGIDDGTADAQMDIVDRIQTFLAVSVSLSIDHFSKKHFFFCPVRVREFLRLPKRISENNC